ncbi:hypothetical protein BCR39DRAFT_513933 [Naematelia encephala]|uniref:MYND-type domain-containing protein n=1 Tax=Naematelia encephala TaxID=71784 RepID=A0A1Y2BIR3_9TREE|nr:hypothetical protein BCR39DRAFT_513933 [Naematelia encephala]
MTLNVNGNAKLDEVIEKDDGEAGSSSSENDDIGVDMSSLELKKKKKKKKKRKPTKKKQQPVFIPSSSLGSIPPEEPLESSESEVETSKWEERLRKGTRTYSIPRFGSLLDLNYRSTLDIFWTSSCRSFQLYTKRLVLRQVEIGDTSAIRRIKMEPIVQKTQLYGSPSPGEIKDQFQNRYLRSSIPRANSGDIGTSSRQEYVFGVTALDPQSITIQPGGSVRIAHRITSAEGWLGNIGLSLTTTSPNSSSSSLSPKRGEIYLHPTFEQCAACGLEGSMFYEIHPQLWGQGLMSEAFEEVLRFAMEEIGCISVEADPTTSNTASIRLCTKYGLRHTHTATENPYGKPQMFHRISKDEWFARNGREIKDVWGGKQVCRWCLNFRKAPPIVACSGCNWAKYCSRQCQLADWSLQGGHQSECDHNQSSSLSP